MGVHGLWRLIEPSGKPVPLETLENKVLAVDVSIWLHQAVKGFQDSKGAPVPNAHLLGIYHRVCKLLYFKIKPVFVFDGGVPALKKQTIAKRNQLKSRNSSEADRLQKQLLNTLLKHTAISKVLSEKTKASITAQTKKGTRHDNLYMLPTIEEADSTLSSSEEESEETPDSSPKKQWDLHTIDTNSAQFKALPLEVKHEILTELKDTRKQSSWGKLHELPKQSDDFSTYQMSRLLKRQSVQAALDETAKEMGGSSLSLAELESLLKDQGIQTTNDNIGKRIASDENTRFLYIRDVKEALEKAKLEQQQSEAAPKTKVALEEDEDLRKAIALSLQEAPSTSSTEKIQSRQEFSFLENFKDADFQSDTSDEEFEEVPVKKTLGSAQSYMVEYSGLTPNEIAKILADKGKEPVKRKELARIGKKAKENSKTLKVISEDVVKSHLNEKDEVEIEVMSDSGDSTGLEFAAIEEKSKDAPENEVKNKESSEDEQNANATKTNENNNKALDGNADGRMVLIEVVDENITTSLKPSFSEKDDETENVEVMSDSGDSTSSVEFITVQEEPKDTECEKKEPLTVEINPSEEDDLDLFSDIFEDKADVKKLDEIISKGLKVTNSETKEGISRMTTNEGKVSILTNESVRNTKGIEEKLNKPVNEIEDGARNGHKPFEKRPPTQNSPNDAEEIASKVTTSETKEEISETPINKGNVSILQDENVKITAAIRETIDKPVNGTEDETRTKSETPMDTDTSQIVETVSDICGESTQKLSIKEMQELKDNLQRERTDLLIEKSTKERLASNITDQMYQEAQELLELFGVPYVIAPMEAEAQCAFLDEIQLTDGTITDDSDIWLFGGRTVYKNFFNQSKYVMEFKAENIKHHFKLSREQMILLALLVGSDYTIGLQGVGPVTALEILAAFPPSTSSEFSLSQAQLISGLSEFKSWFKRGQSGGPGRSNLKSKLKNIAFTDNFPSLQVVHAYLDPKIETSREKFTWSKPDIVGLSLFAREKFAWSSKKTDEILNPVVKRLEENRMQRSIKDFFKTKFKLDSGEAEGKMSNRVKSAIGRMGKTQEELIAEEMELLEKAKRKTRGKKDTEGEPKKKRSRKGKCEEHVDADRTSKGKPRRTRKQIDTVENYGDVAPGCEDARRISIADSRDNHENDATEASINNQIPLERITKISENYGNIASGTDKIDCPDEIPKPKTRRGTKSSKKESTIAPDTKSNKPAPGRKRKTIVDEETGVQVPRTRKKKETLTNQIEALPSVSTDVTEELKLYENVAVELKLRRQRRNELAKARKEESANQKQKKKPEVIPEELQEDEEVRLLLATTSTSALRVDEIQKQVEKEAKENMRHKRLPGLHNKEVIHQKLRDKSDLLRNKMRAIEVFRKSKKGPGYVEKRQRVKKAPKEDAGLSEDSDD